MDFLSAPANFHLLNAVKLPEFNLQCQRVSGSTTRGQKCIAGFGAFLFNSYAICYSKWKLNTRISRVSRGRTWSPWHFVLVCFINALLSSCMSNWHFQTKQMNTSFKTEKFHTLWKWDCLYLSWINKTKSRKVFSTVHFTRKPRTNCVQDFLTSQENYSVTSCVMADKFSDFEHCYFFSAI